MENNPNNTPKAIELSEGQLDDIAGGGATKNQYDPTVCKNLSSIIINVCNGSLSSLGRWCDHYRRVKIENTNRYQHSCAMNAFPPYYGDP